MASIYGVKGGSGVISNQELKNKLLESSMNQQQVVQCSHLLVICVETEIDEAYIETYFKRVIDIEIHLNL